MPAIAHTTKVPKIVMCECATTKSVKWVGCWTERSEIDADKSRPDSAAKWPSHEELKTQMEGAGRRDVSYDLLFGGVAAIHIGTKP